MKKLVLFIVLGNLFNYCYSQNESNEFNQEKIWKLSWEMTFSFFDNNYERGELQLDTLLNISNEIDKEFIQTGMEILFKRNKFSRINEIFNNLAIENKRYLCSTDLFQNNLCLFPQCISIELPDKENILYPELQREILIMSILDQYIRGGEIDALLKKYSLDINQITKDLYSKDIDEENLIKLKSIIEKYGFLTKEMIGQDAMSGLFLLIQHSNMDLEWQASQLDNVKNAVIKEDLKAEDYALLYDRIQIMKGRKQLFGTQCEKIDLQNKIVSLYPVEDVENLNKRRMEMKMMPIEMYMKILLQVYN